ncbi:MAG: hypothetical protein DMD60_08870 [Gemmatimonadetes bacterium]|nr:MAG: hypothetical protein DMD60_08870 [Gemmatimonadota bacterium]
MPAGEQLRAEPCPRGLADHVERAGAQWLRQCALETRQPGRGPAREPNQLRQLDLEPRHGRFALGTPLVEGAGGELAPRPRVHEQEPPTDRDVTYRE